MIPALASILMWFSNHFTHPCLLSSLLKTLFQIFPILLNFTVALTHPQKVIQQSPGKYNPSLPIHFRTYLILSLLPFFLSTSWDVKLGHSESSPCLSSVISYHLPILHTSHIPTIRQNPQGSLWCPMMVYMCYLLFQNTILFSLFQTSLLPVAFPNVPV